MPRDSYRPLTDALALSAIGKGSAPLSPGLSRARLFLSLDPSDRCRDRLAVWQRHAMACREDLRPVAPEALHVTLAFLGARPECEIPEIARVALAAVATLSPARFRAVRVAALPRRASRLLALDLDDEGARAAEIQAAASGALEAGGFHDPDGRAFWPHMTFARVGRGGVVPSIAFEPPYEPIDAGRVTLYRSHPGPNGSRYESCGQVRLRSDGADTR